MRRRSLLLAALALPLALSGLAAHAPAQAQSMAPTTPMAPATPMAPTAPMSAGMPMMQMMAPIPFTPAAFEAAQKAGGPILVEVTAPWCPTCKAQKPILSDLLMQPKFGKMTVLQVDFDSQKDALKMLGVQMQSTLISYKGKQEVGRSTGVTDKAAIAAQIDKSI